MNKSLAFWSQILAVSPEQMIGQYHPLILHFPIVLFAAALVTDILNYFGKSRALYVGHWLVIAGVVTCIPTIITGLAASAGYDVNDPIIVEHRFLGYSTAIFGSFYAGLRISVMRWNLKFRPFYYLVLSVILVALVSWTSDYGGLITRGETPFSSGKSMKETALMDHSHGWKKTPDLMVASEFPENLKKTIGVKDVIPIFAANKCEHCHAKCFPNGQPSHFFDGTPEQAFLEKNPDGTLKDYTTSNFYRTVILENRMPVDHHGKVIGLTTSERMILLLWLQNGAPMN
jgi:Predicted membrane protein